MITMHENVIGGVNFMTETHAGGTNNMLAWLKTRKEVTLSSRMLIQNNEARPTPTSDIWMDEKWERPSISTVAHSVVLHSLCASEEGHIRALISCSGLSPPDPLVSDHSTLHT